MTVPQPVKGISTLTRRTRIGVRIAASPKQTILPTLRRLAMTSLDCPKRLARHVVNDAVDLIDLS
jgi:hypothetical protein